MSLKRGIDGLKEILGEVEFPADKETVVAHAQEVGTDERLLSALRAMPPVQYGAPDEVLASVPVSRSPEDDTRTESERAQQRREHTRPGLSEQTKETRPVNPIEEETGENRKG